MTGTPGDTPRAGPVSREGGPRTPPPVRSDGPGDRLPLPGVGREDRRHPPELGVQSGPAHDTHLHPHPRVSPCSGVRNLLLYHRTRRTSPFVSPTGPGASRSLNSLIPDPTSTEPPTVRPRQSSDSRDPTPTSSRTSGTLKSDVDATRSAGRGDPTLSLCSLDGTLGSDRLSHSTLDRVRTDLRLSTSTSGPSPEDSCPHDPHPPRKRIFGEPGYVN